MGRFRRFIERVFPGATKDTSKVVSLKNPQDWQVGENDTGVSTDARSVLGLSAVWACVNLLSGTQASLPLMVYRTKPGGAREIARDHPLFRVLHDSPNALQTAVDFWGFITASLELWGNGYARKVRSGGQVAGLIPIMPQLPQVSNPGNGLLRYQWTENGKSFDLTSDDVLHIRGFGGNPLGGMSTLTFAARTFGLALAADRAAANTFKNGMRASGVLSTDATVSLTKEQREEFDTYLGERFAGAVNAGRPMVLDRGMKWSQLTLNPEDAQMLETRGFSVEEVCRYFGVPPFMVGHTSNSTSWGSGLEQQTLGFQKFTLRLRLKRIEQALEKQLLSAADRAAGIVIEFSLEGLLRGDSRARTSFYQSGLTNGWLTINEVRALENLPPIEGGDVPRMQSQNVPITATPTAPALPAE